MKNDDELDIVSFITFEDQIDKLIFMASLNTFP